MLAFTSDYRILSTTYSSSASRWAASALHPAPLLLLITVGDHRRAVLVSGQDRHRTRIRATAQDRDAPAHGRQRPQHGSARLRARIGAGGSGGALIAPIYYIFPRWAAPSPSKPSVVVVLGGMGSIVGATLGGVLIGMSESLSAVYIVPA